MENKDKLTEYERGYQDALDFMIRWLDDKMDVPCNYVLDDVEIDEFMIENAPGWCEKCEWHSGNDGRSCWKKYFEILKSQEEEVKDE